MRRLHGLVAAGLALACLPCMVRGQQFLGKNAQQWQAELAAGKSAAERRSAAFALGKIGKGAREALGNLTARLDDLDADVREATAFAIGEICDAAGIAPPDALTK